VFGKAIVMRALDCFNQLPSIMFSAQVLISTAILEYEDMGKKHSNTAIH
jgi:hypothetical protein